MSVQILKIVKEEFKEFIEHLKDPAPILISRYDFLEQKSKGLMFRISSRIEEECIEQDEPEGHFDDEPDGRTLKEMPQCDRCPRPAQSERRFWTSFPGAIIDTPEHLCQTCSTMIAVQGGTVKTYEGKPVDGVTLKEVEPCRGCRSLKTPRKPSLFLVKFPEARDNTLLSLCKRCCLQLILRHGAEITSIDGRPVLCSERDDHPF